MFLADLSPQGSPCQTRLMPNTKPTPTDVEELAEALWQHRGELVRMATELPTALAAASAQLRDAGAGAQRAGKYLSGDVKKFAGHAADVLEESKHQLLAVLHALEGAGKMLRNMPIIGDMGKAMSEHLGAIGEVADNLDVVGKKVRGLGNRLADVGGDLGSMGKSLIGSANSLDITGPAPAAPAKKSAAKKTATKKTATKKAPAPQKTATSKVTAAKRAPAKKTGAAGKGATRKASGRS